MSEVIANRQMYVKEGVTFTPTEIGIFAPTEGADGLYVCRVVFTNPPKYSASIKGADGINALEGALAYIDKICANSVDPEFHWEVDGGRHNGRPD